MIRSVAHGSRLSGFVCRSCGSPALQQVLNLGEMPLANRLITETQLSDEEPVFPLNLVFCSRCKLAQITETVPPETLFREYLYFSSFSDTMLRHAKELVDRLIASRGLGKASLVVEIGSNDGYLLQYYKRVGIVVLGIEPATNVAHAAQEDRGIPTLPEFFGEALGKRLSVEGKRADVIHVHNVLAHVADLNGFVEGIRWLLRDDGMAVIEVPYVKDLIDRCEFDTIYHEHLCYFSVMSVRHLFRQHHLVIDDVEHVPVHGGSLRLFVRREDPASLQETDGAVSVRRILEEESERGMDRVEFYSSFGQRVEELKDSLRLLVQRLKRSGSRLAGYGASAKGAILLNYCGIGREFLDFVVDRSTYKQGRYMPGVRVPVYSPERLLKAMPDYVLLLIWNLAEEILKQQVEYRQRGGRFIIPVPTVTVL